MKTLFLFLFATAAIAQNCTSTNPCVQVSLANSNTLPSATVLWTCVGMPSSNCTSQQLAAAKVGQTPSNLCPTGNTGTGNWKCIQFTQTKTPQNYNDPHSWGSTINYAAQGTVTGGVSALSPVFTFQIPQAPVTAKPPVFNGNRMVTTGTAGLQ